MEEQLTDREELIYLAALVDGEGCITVAWHPAPLADGTIGRYLTPVMRMCNTNTALINPFVARFVGNSYTCRQPRVEKHKPIWVWQASHGKAADCAMELYPFLRGKKMQAFIVGLVDKVNKKQRSNRKGHRKPEWKQWFEEMAFNKIRELNKRGT